MSDTGPVTGKPLGHAARERRRRTVEQHIETRLAEVTAPLHAEIAELRTQTIRLREHLARVTGGVAEPFSVPQASRRTGEAYEADPRHDPKYVDAVMRGAPPDELTALEKEIATELVRHAFLTQNAGRPATAGEMDLGDIWRSRPAQMRAAMAARQGEMVALGRAMVPDNTARQGRECENSHQVDDPEATSCEVCGGRVLDRSESFVRPLTVDPLAQLGGIPAGPPPEPVPVPPPPAAGPECAHAAARPGDKLLPSVWCPAAARGRA